MIQWKRIDGGAFVGRRPGLRLAVRPSYWRYACSNRWGWIICSESGILIAKSPITRHKTLSYGNGRRDPLGQAVPAGSLASG